MHLRDSGKRITFWERGNVSGNGEKGSGESVRIGRECSGRGESVWEWKEVQERGIE
jgi:hypothetical protein